ncbi:protein MAINTENANCE OF MERISTEMS-like [Camellia sinensis]|uniref:protein MAINTENANCE OF MERISTEMS-like n=1 Tax=Camellia sinensis TaxID=4442 RepID=UPI001036EF0E|nr:protein MAINTENANCE OF MERISTEMS-like [Camellia sinensis]
MGEWVAAWDTLLGAHPPILQASIVRYTWFEEHYSGEDPDTDEEAEQYARAFLLFLFDTTLFSNRWNTVGLYFLGALVVLQQVHFYDWGAAGLTTLYGYMSSTSRMCESLIGGYWRAWELWVYAYFPTLAPEPVEETLATIPFSDVYDGQLCRRTRESFMFFRQFFDTVMAHEITWQPWDAIPSRLQDQYHIARTMSQFHILFEGPICHAWFLSKRFVRQTMGAPAPFVLMAPPPSMKETHKLSAD